MGLGVHREERVQGRTFQAEERVSTRALRLGRVEKGSVAGWNGLEPREGE